MMNEQVGMHLNLLMEASTPAKILGNGEISGPPRHVCADLASRIGKILDEAWPSVLDARIRKAASKRETVSTFRDSDLVAAVRPQVQAVLDEDNARRLAEYEAYRALCEQGVATAPNLIGQPSAKGAS